MYEFLLLFKWVAKQQQHQQADSNQPSRSPEASASNQREEAWTIIHSSPKTLCMMPITLLQACERKKGNSSSSTPTSSCTTSSLSMGYGISRRYLIIGKVPLLPCRLWFLAVIAVEFMKSVFPNFPILFYTNPDSLIWYIIHACLFLRVPYWWLWWLLVTCMSNWSLTPFLVVDGSCCCSLDSLRASCLPFFALVPQQQQQNQQQNDYDSHFNPAIEQSNFTNQL